MRLLTLVFDVAEATIVLIARALLTMLRALLGLVLFAVGLVSAVLPFISFSASGQGDVEFVPALVGLSVALLAFAGAYWLFAGRAPWQQPQRAGSDAPPDSHAE